MTEAAVGAATGGPGVSSAEVPAVPTDGLYDPFEEGYLDSPYAQYARLRDLDPVHHSGLLHGWVVTRFDDVGRLLRDPSISSDIGNATPTPLTVMELERLAEHDRASRSIVLLDDPDHARIRRLMADPFRPREIEKLRAFIARRMEETLDGLRAERGSGRVEFDLIADFAYPLPVEVISVLLGVPAEDHGRFRVWTQAVARAVDPVMSQEERDRCSESLDEMYQYLADQVAEKRRNPADDLISALAHGSVDGEGLSDQDLMAQLVTLYMAGHEPTSVVIGAGMVALIAAPDQASRLRDDRSLVRNAVSEFLRFDGPNQFVRRITTRPTVVGECELPAGAVVYASPAAANRDPRRWGETAERLVVDRPDASQHLQFGAGPHSCLGSHLARLQAELAFDALLRRVHDIEPAGSPVWSARMFLRGLDAVPVTCTISA